MFKLRVEHGAYGGNEDLSACAWDYVARFDVDDDGEVEEDDDDPRVDATRMSLGTAYDFLEGLGAIRCDSVAGRDSNAAASLFGLL